MLIQNKPSTVPSTPDPDLEKKAKEVKAQYQPLSLNTFLSDFKKKFTQTPASTIKDGFEVISGNQRYSIHRREDHYLLERTIPDPRYREASISLKIPIPSSEKSKANQNARFIVQLKRGQNTTTDFLKDNMFLSDSLSEEKESAQNAVLSQTAEAIFKHQEKRSQHSEKSKFSQRPVVLRSAHGGSAGTQNR